MIKNGLRPTLALLAGAALLVSATGAGAQVPLTAKCEAGKVKCANKHWTALLGCYSKNSGKPDPIALQACIDKALLKWTGGLFPEKGCFGKLELKPPCATEGDSTQIDTTLQAAVTLVNEALDPPPTNLSKCTAGQQKCVANLVKGLLGCYAKDVTKPDPILTPACLDKAITKYTGGIDPAKGCFAKLENKVPNDCIVLGQSAPIQADTEQTSRDISTLLECGRLAGDLICGDNVATCGEDCDDGNTSNNDGCPADCTIDECTPQVPSSRIAQVNFSSSGPEVGSIVVLIDYPEGKLNIPGSGGSAPVQGAVSGFPSDTSNAPNDFDHALRQVVTKNTPFTGFGTSGQLLNIDFLTCEAASAPLVGDFTCTVLSATDPFFTDITNQVTCSVALP